MLELFLFTILILEFWWTYKIKTNLDYTNELLKFLIDERLKDPDEKPEETESRE